MLSLKKLFSDSMIYGLSSIVGRFLNYLLVPIYTYTLVSSGNYGVVTNIYAYVALLFVLLTFGMETTFFYFANKQKENYPRVFSTALYMVGITGIVFVALVFSFITSLSNAIGYADHPEYLKIMATVVAIDAFQAILFAYLRFKDRPWKFAILKLTFIIMNIGMNLFVFLAAPRLAISHPEMMSWYSSDKQVFYIFLINLLCNAPITLAFLPELRHLRYGIDRSLVRQMLRYSWPLLLLGLAGILNQVADKICYRFIMPGPEGDAQLGIYGACAKIAMIMAMITQAFRFAYEPFVFSGGDGKESKKSQALVMKYFVMFTLLAFLGVMGYLPLLKYLISERYWEGLNVIPIVMIAEIMMGIYFNLSFWYKLIAKTWWGAIFSTAGCIVLLAVNFIFVPNYGYTACAWGGVCGYGVCMLLSFFVGQKLNPVPYPVKTIGLLFLLALVLFSAMSLTKGMNIWLSMSINTILIIIYLAIVMWYERDLVKQLTSRIKSTIITRLKRR